MLPNKLCRMDHTLPQTSSRGTKIMKTTIWAKFQKHCENAVTIKMGLQLLQLKTILYGTF